MSRLIMLFANLTLICQKLDGGIGPDETTLMEQSGLNLHYFSRLSVPDFGLLPKSVVSNV